MTDTKSDPYERAAERCFDLECPYDEMVAAFADILRQELPGYVEMKEALKYAMNAHGRGHFIIDSAYVPRMDMLTWEAVRAAINLAEGETDD